MEQKSLRTSSVTVLVIERPSTCEPLGGPGDRNTASQICLLKRKDVHKPLLWDWRFGLSGADGAGNEQDLLSARHRAAPPPMSRLVGLGTEIRPVEVACSTPFGPVEAKRRARTPFVGLVDLPVGSRWSRR
jgi:hypothetical protein